MYRYGDVKTNHRTSFVLCIFYHFYIVISYSPDFITVTLDVDTYLSSSPSRDESRNPFAKGLLSIFNFVICNKIRKTVRKILNRLIYIYILINWSVLYSNNGILIRLSKPNYIGKCLYWIFFLIFNPTKIVLLLYWIYDCARISVSPITTNCNISSLQAIRILSVSKHEFRRIVVARG